MPSRNSDHDKFESRTDRSAGEGRRYIVRKHTAPAAKINAGSTVYRCDRLAILWSWKWKPLLESEEIRIANGSHVVYISDVAGHGRRTANNAPKRRSGPAERVEQAGSCAMPGAAGTLRTTLAFCAVSATWTGVCPAQTREAVAEPDVSPKYLSLTQFDAYLELKADYTHREVRQDSGGPYRRPFDQTNREWTVEERLGFRLGGVVLDPSLLSFGGDLSFALTQNRYREDGSYSDLTDQDSGHLLQYNLRANLFQGKAFSGSVYGLRQDDRISRRFQPALDQRRNGYGTSWVFNHDRIPMELSYDYLETDRTGNSDPRDDEHFTDSTFRYSADWRISERQKLKLSYEHGELKQEYQGSAESFETTRDLVTAEHQLDFGPREEHNLRTLLNWQEESGDFARDFFRVGPQMTLKHRDNLQSIYKYQFNRERYEGLDVESQRADFQIIHQVYANLTTVLDVFALYEHVEDDTDTRQYGASVDWQYNRRNPYGHLYANLALAYDTEEVDGDDGRRLVLDEAQTFRDPGDVILRNRNAVYTTVVVTDSSGSIFLRKDLDYTVVQREDVTRLVRLPGGRIADGDTVLVDYQFRTPADGELDTIRVDFSVEQRLGNGITPYYRLSFRNQEDDTSTGFTQQADRTDHHRLGINYETERYRVGAEVEIFDDTIEPYNAFHVDGLLHVWRQTDHALDAAARCSRFFFDDADDRRNVTLIDVDVNQRWRLSDSVSTLARVGYRFEDDSVDGYTHAWDVNTGLEYALGDLSGELTLEYDRLMLPESDDEGFGAFVRIRREFPDLLRRGGP